MSEQADYTKLTRVAAQHRPVYDAVVAYRDAIGVRKDTQTVVDYDNRDASDREYNPADSGVMYTKRDLVDALQKLPDDEAKELAKNIGGWVLRLDRMEKLNTIISEVDGGKVCAFRGEKCSTGVAVSERQPKQLDLDLGGSACKRTGLA